jgi:hypothetical protein
MFSRRSINACLIARASLAEKQPGPAPPSAHQAAPKKYQTTIDFQVAKLLENLGLCPHLRWTGKASGTQKFSFRNSDLYNTAS